MTFFKERNDGGLKLDFSKVSIYSIMADLTKLCKSHLLNCS